MELDRLEPSPTPPITWNHENHRALLWAAVRLSSPLRRWGGGHLTPSWPLFGQGFSSYSQNAILPYLNRSLLNLLLFSDHKQSVHFLLINSRFVALRPVINSPPSSVPSRPNSPHPSHPTSTDLLAGHRALAALEAVAEMTRAKMTPDPP